jgi:bifunctional non-homologous end joining protein LigD
VFSGERISPCAVIARMAAQKLKNAELSFSHVEKVYFPSGYTKGAMIEYYLQVAPYMVPHLRDRPVTLIRFPNGVKGESFYEKNAPAHRPDWIKTFAVPRGSDHGNIDYILINDAKTLAWCANLGTIEFHPFLHRSPRLQVPTSVAFDLDPGEGADILTCAEVAFLLKELFDALKLQSFPKVSGSKGIQIYVPLNTPVTYDSTTPFARTVAELMAQRYPQLVVSSMAKALRKKKVLIDWSQNNQSKTTVSVYSLRGKRDQPFVSMPISWEELQKARTTKKSQALFFTPDQALSRLKKKGDLFAPILQLKQKLPKEFRALRQGTIAGGSEDGVTAAGQDQETTSRAKRPRTVASKPTAAEEKRPKKVSGKTSAAALKRYAQKRDFSKTREPSPSAVLKKKTGLPRFVIQKHAATRLHFDFRLEMNGTLKSWAVPKGLPYEVGVRRAAFQVEDHPISYLKFEGTIPKGQYGGGTVMVWDLGTYEILGGEIEKGDLKLRLQGGKLAGEWHIFRIKSDEAKPVWLIVKAHPPMKPLSVKKENTSVLSHRTMEKIASDNDAQWNSH